MASSLSVIDLVLDGVIVLREGVWQCLATCDGCLDDGPDLRERGSQISAGGRLPEFWIGSVDDVLSEIGQNMIELLLWSEALHRSQPLKLWRSRVRLMRLRALSYSVSGKP
jgi:hypothetical protein